jgi:hypothetical protein
MILGPNYVIESRERNVYEWTRLWGGAIRIATLDLAEREVTNLVREDVVDGNEVEYRIVYETVEQTITRTIERTYQSWLT